jgi:hypothetical protein
LAKERNILPLSGNILGKRGKSFPFSIINQNVI